MNKEKIERIEIGVGYQMITKKKDGKTIVVLEANLKEE